MQSLRLALVSYYRDSLSCVGGRNSKKPVGGGSDVRVRKVGTTHCSMEAHYNVEYNL